MTDSRPTPPIFYASCIDGYAPTLKNAAHRVLARKRPVVVQVHFATRATLVPTLEGAVPAHTGDAIITGTAGEQWPVLRAQFSARYLPVAPCQPGCDGLYQSLPTEVLALPVPEPFSVVLCDGHSTLSGQAGDWLVDYGDGTLGIVAKAIFEHIYEIMGQH